MLPPLAEIRQVAKGTTRRTAFFVAGGVVVSVGAAFLIVALWIAMEQAFNSLAAALVVAGLLIAIGLVIIGIAPRKLRFTPPEARLRHAARNGALYRPTGAFPPLAEAFLYGLAVSIQIRNRRR